MIGFLYPFSAGAAITLILVCPLSRRGRGRHISRRLGHALGLERLSIMFLQTVWLVAEAGAALAFGKAVGVLVMVDITVVWLFDDLFTGGPDDRPKRKHEWVRIKFRMPKPVKLRPAERVRAPVPA